MPRIDSIALNADPSNAKHVKPFPIISASIAKSSKMTN